MAEDSFAEKEKLLHRKHDLEWANFKARRELEAARQQKLYMAGDMVVGFGPDPFALEEASLKERQSRELLGLISEKMSGARPAEPLPQEKKRFSGSVTSLSAARKLEAFVESKGMSFTDFAIQAGTTDRTIREFRKTGKVRRDIFHNIARAMGLKPEDLLK
jgi:hypothetical protein